jgi:4-hydroxybenzoate polyprenyltransferase
MAPVGAFLAISGRWSEPAGALLTLAAAVLCWVAGFDILYSLQDEAFDRENGLHSVPAAFGVSRAILISRALHVFSVLMFALTGVLFAELGTLYFLGVLLIAGMLLYEQSLVRADDLSRIDAAFFNINGAISVLFMAVVLLERLLW